MGTIRFVEPADQRFLPALPERVERALRLLKERLGRRFGGELVEVRLFGSFARGEQHEESDVDVLILFEHENWDEGALFREIAEVDRSERVWISPLVCSRSRFEAMRRDEVGIALEIDAQGMAV